MRRLALLLLTSVAIVLGAHAPASAMIAIDVLRGPLRTAAQAAASCPGVIHGRYLVHLRIDGEGQGSESDLHGSPDGVPTATEECIERAFDVQAYPAVARGRTGGIQVSYPFIVAEHASKQAVGPRREAPVSRSELGRSR